MPFDQTNVPEPIILTTAWSKLAERLKGLRFDYHNLFDIKGPRRAIRCMDTLACPLSAAFGSKYYSNCFYYYYGQALGFTMQETEQIVQAADGVSDRPILRAELEKICGLQPIGA